MRWISFNCDLSLWCLALGVTMESGASMGSKRRPHLIVVLGPLQLAIGPHADQVT